MRLRTAFFSALSMAAVVTAAAGEASGVYASLTAASTTACARACAEDGICMAWSFHDENECRLLAIVPTRLDAQARASGFASRAPAFLQPDIPIVHAAGAIQEPSPPPPEPVAMAQAEDTDELLGGPTGGDLRLGLR